MNLTERLRAVVRSTHTGGPEGLPLHVDDHLHLDDRRGAPSGAPWDPDRVSDLLGGEWRPWQGHRYLVVDRRYPPGHRHGRVAVADAAPGSSGSWPALSVVDAAAAGGRVLFIDLETTGLSGGAGTYAFLVGCGWFDGTAFRVRQFLLTGYAAERGLLEAVGETAAGAAAVATYNGKTFDLPVIDTRYLLHRMPTPFEGMPHVDMLHQARHLWRRGNELSTDQGGSCRLTAMEAEVLGLVREGDVPGFEIPSRYFHYVRSGDPRPLEAVLEHNRLDLLSLAMLTARLAQLLEEGPGAPATAREALGLGRIYQRGGRPEEARACFARAPGLDGDDLARAEALRACAVLCRRARQHYDAAEAWRRLLELPACPAHLAREAREGLAVHCEHRLRDFRTARQLAMASLPHASSTARTQAIHHRVARLDRKLKPGDPPAPLF